MLLPVCRFQRADFDHSGTLSKREFAVMYAGVLCEKAAVSAGGCVTQAECTLTQHSAACTSHSRPVHCQRRRGMCRRRVEQQLPAGSSHVRRVRNTAARCQVPTTPRLRRRIRGVGVLLDVPARSRVVCPLCSVLTAPCSLACPLPAPVACARCRATPPPSPTACCLPSRPLVVTARLRLAS